MSRITEKSSRVNQQIQKMAQRIISTLKVGVFSANAQGKIDYVNEAFVHMLGYKNKDQLLGLRVEDILYASAEEKEKYINTLKLKGCLRDYQFKHKNPDGIIEYLLVNAAYVYGQDNHPVGLEGVIYDMTKQKLSEQKNDIFQKAVEQSADHIMVTDNQGRILYVNKAFENTTGYRKEELIGKNPRILKSGIHNQKFFEDLWNTILSGRVFKSPVTNKKKNGEIYVADQSISPVKNENGEITYFISIWKNITDRMKLQKQLKKERLKLEEIVGMDEKVSRIRKFDQLIDFVVKKTAAILDARKCLLTVIDKSTDDLYVKGAYGITPNTIKNLDLKLGDPVSGLVAEQAQPILVRNADEKHKLFDQVKEDFLGPSFISVPLKLHDRVTGVITVGKKKGINANFDETDLRLLMDIATEVTVALENLRLYKKIKYLTVTDPLTRIYNFRYYIRTLDHEIKRLERFPHPLTLMLIDIDNFKLYNDELGFDAGDKLLKKFSQLLKDNLREIDIVCRYAGDEFAIILPQTDKDGALTAAKKIQESVPKLNKERGVTISIGIAKYHKGMSRLELTNMADKAMYEAKKDKKTRIYLLG